MMFGRQVLKSDWHREFGLASEDGLDPAFPAVDDVWEAGSEV